MSNLYQIKNGFSTSYYSIAVLGTIHKDGLIPIIKAWMGSKEMSMTKWKCDKLQ